MSKTIFEQMRVAAQSTAQHNASVVKLVVGLTDETIISKLRYEYLIGGLMGRCNLGDNAAIDYLPAMDAKPGTPGKWKDFPIKAPETFDPKVHRPLEVHHAYRGLLSGWSNIRASAGLASLKAASTRAPKTEPAASGKAAPVTVASLVVETGVDARHIAAQVNKFEGWLSASLKTNAKRVTGETGAWLRKVSDDLHSYATDLAAAMQADAVKPVPTLVAAIENEETAKALAETRAMLATMRAELAAANAAKATPALAPAKAGRKAKVA